MIYDSDAAGNVMNVNRSVCSVHAYNLNGRAICPMGARSVVCDSPCSLALITSINWLHFHVWEVSEHHIGHELVYRAGLFSFVSFVPC